MTSTPSQALSGPQPAAASLLPLFAAALATTLGGSAIVGTRFIVTGTDPLMLAFLRYGIATLCLLPLTLISANRTLRKVDILPVIGLGVLYFCFHPWAFTASLKYTSAAYGGLVISVTPMLTLILSCSLGYEKATPKKFIGITLALLGVFAALVESAFAAVAGPDAWFGNLLMFGAACIGAIYNVLARSVLKNNSATAVIGYGMTAGSAGLLLLLAIGPVPLELPDYMVSDWLIVGYIGVFGAAAAFFLLVWALKRTTPTRVAVFLSLNPVVAMALGALLLDETITTLQLTGLAMVLAGIFLVNVVRRETTVAK